MTEKEIIKQAFVNALYDAMIWDVEHIQRLINDHTDIYKLHIGFPEPIYGEQEDAEGGIIIGYEWPDGREHPNLDPDKRFHCISIDPECVRFEESARNASNLFDVRGFISEYMEEESFCANYIGANVCAHHLVWAYKKVIEQYKEDK